MARPQVERAGQPWNIGVVRRWVRETGQRAARQPVGSVELEWRLATDPLRLEVTHHRPLGLLAVLLGQKPEGEPERYAVRLANRPRATADGPWCFLCPGCLRKCNLLYLPPGSVRVACRKCFGMAYRSQQTRPLFRTRRNCTTIRTKYTTTTVWKNPRV